MLSLFQKHSRLEKNFYYSFISGALKKDAGSKATWRYNIKGIGFLEWICGRVLICDYRKPINHWSRIETVSHRAFIARLHVEMKGKALYPIAVAGLRANRKVSPPHPIAHIIKDPTWHSFLPVLSFFSWSERIYYMAYWKQANLPVGRFNIMISGNITLCKNVMNQKKQNDT